MIFAVLTAFASAACFAGGSALQHRAATVAPTEDSGLRLMLALAHRPMWLVGFVLCGVAFALHAVALDHGDLALVQPVIVSGIVFAVLIRAALERKLPRGRTLVWLLVTWAGLALFLAVRPEITDSDPAAAAVVVFVVVVGALAGAAAGAADRVRLDQRRGLLLGGAAGLLFGVVAGLLKLVTGQLGSGLGTVLTSWPVYVLALAGACAIVLNQRAYQAAKLSVTSSILNIAQVVVAIAFGVIVFGEDIGGSVPVVVAELAGLAAVVLGIRNLSAVPSPEPVESRA